MIEVRVLGFFQEYTGKNMIEVRYRRGITIEDILRELSPELHKYISEHIENAVILVNGVSINNLDGLATKLRDGDRVALMPVVGGGYSLDPTHLK